MITANTITIDAPDIKGRKVITYKRGQDGFFYLKHIQTDDGMEVNYLDGEGRIAYPSLMAMFRGRDNYSVSFN